MRRIFASFFVMTALVIAGFLVIDKASAEESESSDISPTEIVGDIPGEGEVGLIWWGGGTLLQLSVRLNQEGCDVSSVYTLKLYTDALEYRVNYSYDFEQNSSKNRSFLRQYRNGIPEGDLIVNCSEYFNFEDEDDEVLLGCDETNWSDAVNEYVVSRISLIGEPYVLYCDDEGHAERELGVLVLFPSQYFSHFSYTLDDEDNLRLEDAVYRPIVVVISEHDDYVYEPVFSEVYEACQAQQEWYVYHTRLHDSYTSIPWWEVWEKTDAGREFIRLFKWRSQNDEWSLPSTSIFQNFKSDRPFSLATEICQLYFLDSMYAGLGLDDYLPQSVRDWITKFVDVLPE